MTNYYVYSSYSVRGICRADLYYVIKFVSDLRQVYRGFLRILRFLPPRGNNTDRHDISEILLKVVLSTINQPNRQ